jgi:uncharacterized protein YukE
MGGARDRGARAEQRAARLETLREERRIEDHEGKWGTTPYESWDHGSLVRAVLLGKPNQIAAVGNEWERVGRALNSQADSLERRLAALTAKWSGPAFAQYHVMVTDMVKASRVLGGAALELRDLLYANAETLAKAQRAIQALPPDPVSTVALSGSWGTARVSSAQPVSVDLQVT